MIAENIESNTQIDVQDILHRYIASEMNKAGAALLKLNKEDRQTVLDLLRRSGVFKD